MSETTITEQDAPKKLNTWTVLKFEDRDSDEGVSLWREVGTTESQYGSFLMDAERVAVGQKNGTGSYMALAENAVDRFNIAGEMIFRVVEDSE